MTPQDQPVAEQSSSTKTKNGLVAGVALIIIGLVVLAGQLLDSPNIGLLILPTLAIIFLAWGLITRTFGLIVPGGILAGIGAGVFLMDMTALETQGESEAAIFMLAFAGGWALITLLSVFTTDRLQWWPLIPGGIMAIIGALLLSGEAGLKVLEFSEYLWPIAMIVVGLAIILRRYIRSS